MEEAGRVLVCARRYRLSAYFSPHGCFSSPRLLLWLQAMYDRKRQENYVREARSWEMNQAACDKVSTAACPKICRALMLWCIHSVLRLSSDVTIERHVRPRSARLPNSVHSIGHQAGRYWLG